MISNPGRYYGIKIIFSFFFMDDILNENIFTEKYV